MQQPIILLQAAPCPAPTRRARKRARRRKAGCYGRGFAFGQPIGSAGAWRAPCRFRSPFPSRFCGAAPARVRTHGTGRGGVLGREGAGDHRAQLQHGPRAPHRGGSGPFQPRFASGSACLVGHQSEAEAEMPADTPRVDGCGKAGGNSGPGTQRGHLHSNAQSLLYGTHKAALKLRLRQHPQSRRDPDAGEGHVGHTDGQTEAVCRQLRPAAGGPRQAG